MKSILDPTFEYTSSEETDIAKTFARIRQVQRQNLRLIAVRPSEESQDDPVIRRPMPAYGQWR